MISPLSFNFNIRWSFVLPCLIVLTPFIFFLIGMPYQQIASDAASYAGYATNLATGHGYTFDNAVFTNYREPVYPLFLALVFIIFGVGNYTAVYLAQTILLGLLGLFVFLTFKKSGETGLGYIAGFLVTILPSYGLYTHTVGTELPFAFMLGLIFYLIVTVITNETDQTYGKYALVGLLFGLATLMRVQIILFLPVLMIYHFVYSKIHFKDKRKTSGIMKKSSIALVVFLVVIGAWTACVHSYTGSYSITTGRQGLAIYTRAVRARLSYADITKYAYLWVRRSLTGGEEKGDFLYNNEYHKIGDDYWAMATTSSAAGIIEKQSIATILANPGHYIYGNLIEVLKTLYIEHDYSDVLNKYIRAAMYLVVYGLFVFGCVMLWRGRKERCQGLKSIAALSFLFIIYNIAILSPFDSIPRYNTPYLTFYIVIGFVGLAIFLKRRRGKHQ